MDWKKNTILINIILLIAIVSKAYAFDLKQGHTVFQVGGYWSSQGEGQKINIKGLIGDYFSVTKRSDSSGLVGLGYFLDGQENRLFNMSYGINAFYLANTSVKGYVTQENIFTNLSYEYNVSHFPIYLAAKSTIKTNSPKYSVTIDAGIGPNFMTTGGFKEYSLDSMTVPDSAFSSNTSTTLSVMAGAGIKINQVLGSAPLECGYRFFYLGQGNFSKNTGQLLNTLSTGNSYANGLMCSVTV